MKKLHIAAVAGIAIIAGACSHSNNGWGIDGRLNDGADNTLYIEGFNNGNWYLVDSVKATGGKFEYRAAAPAQYPDIMRLNLDGKYIYFPIDSVDVVNIVSDTLDFDHNYTLDGTVQARTVKSLDSIVTASLAAKGVEATIADEALKRELFNKAFADPSVASVYYLINKSVGGRQLFDLANANDLRLYGAVAQRFATERPDDPRTGYLAAMFKRGRQGQYSQQREIRVPETALFEIERADARGTVHKLSETAKKGGVTVLSFTSYAMEASPAYNALLFKIYDKYKNSGLQIYQIAFDEDETSWRQTAANLPWIAVWNTTTGGNEPLVKYNVGILPTTFIIDREGALAERVSDPAQLEKAVAKYM